VTTGLDGSVDDAQVYDRIGAAYTLTRRADPRIAEAIRAALGHVASALKNREGAG